MKRKIIAGVLLLLLAAPFLRAAITKHSYVVSYQAGAVTCEAGLLGDNAIIYYSRAGWAPMLGVFGEKPVFQVGPLAFWLQQGNFLSRTVENFLARFPYDGFVLAWPSLLLLPFMAGPLVFWAFSNKPRDTILSPPALEQGPEPAP